MKKINLTFLAPLFICAIPSLSSANYAEQCRKMLEQVDTKTNQYVYYEGKTGQTPLKTKIKFSVWKLYQDSLADEMKNDATLKNNKQLEAYLSRLNGTAGIAELINSLSYLPNDQPDSLEIAKYVHNFCEREIKELSDIYAKKWKVTEAFISSKTGDCKKYVEGDKAEQIVGVCNNIQNYVSQLAQRVLAQKVPKLKAEMGYVYKFAGDTEKYVDNPVAIKAFYGAELPTFTLNNFLSEFRNPEVIRQYISVLDNVEQRNFVWDQLLDAPAIITLKQGNNYYYIKMNLSKVRLGDYASDLNTYKQQRKNAPIRSLDRTKIVTTEVEKLLQQGGNKNLQYDQTTGTYSLSLPGSVSVSFQLVVPKEIL